MEALCKDGIKEVLNMKRTAMTNSHLSCHKDTC